MAVRSNNEKILFGVKLRHLRKQAGFAFSDFSKKTGMSISYLNEIEKGKKYPKQDKIMALADALSVDPEFLTSTKIPNQLKPIKDLLESNFLNELPLDLFGINLNKIIEIIADSPVKVGAFISTLVEIARNYSLQEENFYFGALRSYLEINNNYFEELEDAVIAFRKKHSLSGVTIAEEALRTILTDHFNYKIVNDGLSDYPELREIRSVFRPEDRTLLLNASLEKQQKIFQFAKEIGFQELGLVDRALTASIIRVENFEQALSHFSASYFSAALIVSRDAFIEDMKNLFAQERWNPQSLKDISLKYNATHEVIFQRMTNILPRFLGLSKIFIQRNSLNPRNGKVNIERELHIEEKHRPHFSALGEHYCRRWISVALLYKLNNLEEPRERFEPLVEAQISEYHNTSDTYLCMTMATSKLQFGKMVSLTIGIKVDDNLKHKIRFYQDQTIPTRTVNITCERCPITDCEDRVSEPIQLHNKLKKQAIQKALNDILNAK
ncbi:MAG: helix-turn-helix domain-containing protein [Bacteroidia bacterium]|nr:helix-turn-helix domain-containing protein [Bacteroidia bacterium]